MSVTLTQQVPAFRMDDATLERLWSVLEAKCAEAGPPTGRLTVRERVRGAGRRTPETHEHEYQWVDDLRGASSGPGLLRDYALSVSSPWGDNYRRVRFRAPGGGRAAWLEVSAPEAELVPRGGRRRPRTAPAAYGLVRHRPPGPLRGGYGGGGYRDHRSPRGHRLSAARVGRARVPVCSHGVDSASRPHIPRRRHPRRAAPRADRHTRERPGGCRTTASRPNRGSRHRGVAGSSTSRACREGP